MGAAAGPGPSPVMGREDGASSGPRRALGSEIAVRGARKSFGEVVVLRELDLVAGAGEFLTLLGPSGSGKTTLLNAIAGLERLDGGEVLVDGRPIANVPAHERGFGMVFQSYALLPHLTVGENVSYPLAIRRVARDERLRAVRDQLRMVHLEETIERYPSQLSGGQQQRVALARALVFRPKVLLMDEPLGALDRRLRQTLQFEIRELQRQLGMTVVYVTHDQEEALAMSDRIALMQDGRIVQVGSPSDIYRRPVNETVASFFGEMSFIAVDVLATDQESAILRHPSSAEPFSVPAGPGAPLVAGSTATLGIRPEAVTFLDSGTQAGLAGRVLSNTFMGSAWRYAIDLGGERLLAVIPAPSHAAVPVGSVVRVGLAPDGVAVFGGAR